MTLIYLLRHAESIANKEGILAGRVDGISLSKAGKAQSQRIARSLKNQSFSKIYTSPLQRCRETIAPFLLTARKRAKVEKSFIEMDYGRWSGRKLSELRKERLWKVIQSQPSKVKFPSGESFIGAASRIRRGLNKVARENPNGRVLVVTHGDPIKIALQLAMKGDLNFFQKIVIDPGTVSIIEWPSGVILGVNIPAETLKKVNVNRTVAARKVLGGGTDVSPRI